MKIASYNDIEAFYISERPARLCEVCGERLGDSPFIYYFEDGEALYGDVCRECHEMLVLDALVITLLGLMIERSEVKLSIIQWLLEHKKG